jgi:hypothetical protein
MRTRWGKGALALAALAPLWTGCVTYSDVKEIKMVGFSEDVSKGKSVGQFESDDCVYRILGYSLGGAPDVSKAIANARTRKKTSITEVAGEQGPEGQPIRYASNISASYDGFDAFVFGKSCIVVKGVGYL